MTVSNKKIAAGFAAAKQYLWDGVEEPPRNKSSYICLALKNACNKKAISVKVQIACALVISSRLDGAFTMRTWLRARGIFAEDMSNALMQKHRHAWIDLLIKEFSK